MSLDSSAHADGRPVESIDQLVAFLRDGEKPAERWRVGTEHEKIGLYAGSWQPVTRDALGGAIGPTASDATGKDDWLAKALTDGTSGFTGAVGPLGSGPLSSSSSERATFAALAILGGLALLARGAGMRRHALRLAGSRNEDAS